MMFDLAKAAAFHQATRENPGSDLHHLVFADWLEENEEPAAAELIRRAVAEDRVEVSEATTDTAWSGFPLLDVYHRKASRVVPALFRVHRSMAGSRITYVVEVGEVGEAADAAEAGRIAASLFPDYNREQRHHDRVILPPAAAG